MPLEVLVATVYYLRGTVYIGKIERDKDFALLHIQIARGLIIGNSAFCLGF